MREGACTIELKLDNLSAAANDISVSRALRLSPCQSLTELTALLTLSGTSNIIAGSLVANQEKKREDQAWNQIEL